MKTTILIASTTLFTCITLTIYFFVFKTIPPKKTADFSSITKDTFSEAQKVCGDKFKWAEEDGTSVYVGTCTDLTNNGFHISRYAAGVFSKQPDIEDKMPLKRDGFMAHKTISSEEAKALKIGGILVRP